MSAKTLKAKAEKFLSCKNIAVLGVSGTNEQEAANLNFRKLKSLGYNVFPVNPFLQDFDGQECFFSLNAIIEPVEAALIFTHPRTTEKVVKECCEKGIANIWIHRSFGNGSCSDAATKYMKDKKDVNFIDGACPMMFFKNADVGHKCIYHVMKFVGRLPA